MEAAILQNGCLHDVRDASLVCESSQFLTAWRLLLSMKPWSYIWLEFGLFSTVIAIIRACACWALFVVTLTNTVHLIYIYIYVYIYLYSCCRLPMWKRMWAICCVVISSVFFTIHRYPLVLVWAKCINRDLREMINISLVDRWHFLCVLDM